MYTAIVAIRDGTAKNNKVRANGFTAGKGSDANAKNDPEFVALAKSAGMTPEDAVKFTKLFRR
jgi:hypothetical protein